jgi:hypothetical protein
MNSETLDLLQKLAATMGTGGLVFVLIVLYFVNRERVHAQAQNLKMAVEGIKAMNKIATAINSVGKKIDQAKKRGVR